MTDVVLPLMTPVKLANGETVDNLVVKKGAHVTIGIKTVNYDKRLFGQDADDFRPERFDNLPKCIEMPNCHPTERTPLLAVQSLGKLPINSPRAKQVKERTLERDTNTKLYPFLPA